MVSDFRKKKLTYLFKMFFNNDGSGTVTKKDFDSMTAGIAKAKGWAPGDEAYKQLEQAILDIWEGILKIADKNNDGEIGLDEWIALWDDAFKDPSKPHRWQEHYCRAIFFIQDASGDGAIDEDDFLKVQTAFGTPKEVVEQAFVKVVDGKTSISFEDFQKLWKEFFTSDDENAPGNHIFGNLHFDN